MTAQFVQVPPLSYQSTQVDEQVAEVRPEQVVQAPPDGTEVLVVQVDVALLTQLPFTKVKVEQSELEHSKLSAWAQAALA